MSLADDLPPLTFDVIVDFSRFPRSTPASPTFSMEMGKSTNSSVGHGLKNSPLGILWDRISTTAAVLLLTYGAVANLETYPVLAVVSGVCAITFPFLVGETVGRGFRDTISTAAGVFLFASGAIGSYETRPVLAILFVGFTIGYPFLVRHSDRVRDAMLGKPSDAEEPRSRA